MRENVRCVCTGFCKARKEASILAERNHQILGVFLAISSVLMYAFFVCLFTTLSVNRFYAVDWQDD
jgi:hypothetical protein